MKKVSTPVVPEQKSRLRKKLKITGIVAACVLAAFLIGDAAAAVVQIERWIRPEKTGWDASPAEYGLDYYSFELTTASGTVTGWKIAAQTPIDADAEDWTYTTDYSDKTVVFAPNYDSNRQMNDLGGLDYLAALCAAGYNVITFDWTGSGYSDGRRNVFDLDKAAELEEVVRYAKQETGASFLAVAGVGFGCYPAAVATADCGEVNALILDSCYESFSDALFGNYSAWAEIPYQPVKATVQWLFPLLSGIRPDDAALTDPINRLNGKSVFFIQGARDEVFGTEDASHLQSLASVDNETSLWLVDGATHLRTYAYDGEGYVSRVTAFLGEAYGDRQV